MAYRSSVVAGRLCSAAAGRLPLHVGTDCSGLGAVLIALQSLEVAFRHVFASEIDHVAIQQLFGTFLPEVFFLDVFSRRSDQTPCVDVYCCGFPCQPFSQAGRRTGFGSSTVAGSGHIFFHILDYIRGVNPRLFILENVEGLEFCNDGECFRTILRALYDLVEYNIYWSLLNTKDYGVPQNRARYFFVGILRTFDEGTFCFPQAMPCPPLASFLEPRMRRPTWQDLPGSGNAAHNVVSGLQAIVAMGHSPFDEPWVVDCDSSHAFSSVRHNVSPCLTRCRSRGYWLTSHGRRMTMQEQMRLQGIPVDHDVHVAAADFCKLLGNSISINVLRSILRSALPAARLWDFQL